MPTKPKTERVYLKRNYLYLLRKDRGLSQYKVALKMDMETPTYNQIEAGKQGSLMNAIKLLKLAEIFEVSVDLIVSEEARYLMKCKYANGYEDW